MLNFILGYCLLKISVYICVTLILKLKIMKATKKQTVKILGQTVTVN